MAREVPSQIGRYQVIGQLAIGGMAELLLGRLNGPSGFERPVVIKRILPHMANDEAFRSMFLDEARIAAGIRHPNVVHVEELGQEGAELFLVMEYLNGETMGGVMRRLNATGERLDRLIGAHVVAEACAGLQAAHELVDSDGASVKLVHRDVSPDNLFVTYDGKVKVLDFGIAQAEGRFTKTRTGLVKGKWAYMSPEQCRGEELDQRSDIFALGVVLFELTVHRRLFKRANELLTLHAITEDPILKPSDVVSGYPASLEAICVRALARDRERRYESARSLRRDLVAVLSKLSHDTPAEDRLRDLMRSLFADRIEEKSALLNNVRLGNVIDHLPEALTQASSREDDSPEPELPQPTSTRARWVLAAVAVFTLSVAAAFSYRYATKRQRITVVSSVSSAAIEKHVRIQLDTLPSGAHVRLDGVDQGLTPVTLDIPSRPTPAKLVLAKDGYTDYGQPVALDVDQRVLLSLVKAEPPLAAKPPRPHARPAAPKPKNPSHDIALFE